MIGEAKNRSPERADNEAEARITFALSGRLAQRQQVAGSGFVRQRRRKICIKWTRNRIGQMSSLMESEPRERRRQQVAGGPLGQLAARRKIAVQLID